MEVSRLELSLIAAFDNPVNRKIKYYELYIMKVVPKSGEFFNDIELVKATGITDKFKIPMKVARKLMEEGINVSSAYFISNS